MEITSKSDTLPFISQSWVDFEEIYNKFLDPLGLTVMPSKNIQKNIWLSVFELTVTLSELDS